MTLKIKRINKQHNRKVFDCGQADLNAYITTTARQHSDKGLSKTFVLIDDEQPDNILGYYTLAVCEIQPPHHEKKFKNYPYQLPALKLARLAVDINHQKKGYARLLLSNVIHKAMLIEQQVGIIGIIINAKNQTVVQMYKKYGFILLNKSLNLFMPIELCKKLKNQ